MQGACSGGSCGLMVLTGIRLAPQAMLTLWRAVLIIVGTLVLALTKNKAGLDHCRCGGAWFGASVAFRMRMMSASSAQPPACRQARIEELTRTAISMTYVSWPHIEKIGSPHWTISATGSSVQRDAGPVLATQ